MEAELYSKHKIFMLSSRHEDAIECCAWSISESYQVSLIHFDLKCLMMALRRPDLVQLMCGKSNESQI
jgi:hypothetical protein